MFTTSYELELSEDERMELEKLSRSRTADAAAWSSYVARSEATFEAMLRNAEERRGR